jgi:hypothetical protein
MKNSKNIMAESLKRTAFMRPPGGKQGYRTKTGMKEM